MATTIDGTTITFTDNSTLSSGNGLSKINTIATYAGNVTIFSSILNGNAQFKLISETSSVINITSTANTVTITGA